VGSVGERFASEFWGRWAGFRDLQGPGMANMSVLWAEPGSEWQVPDPGQSAWLDERRKTGFEGNFWALKCANFGV
jgi:hypothetical protein